MVKWSLLCGVLMAVVSGCAGEVSDPTEPTISVLDDDGPNQDEAATEVTTSPHPQGKKTLGDPAITTDAHIQGKKMFGDGF